MPQDNNPGGRFLGIGLEMCAGVGLGVLGGWWIDKRIHSSPWGVIIGAFLGLAAGMYLLIKEAMNANKG